MKSQIVPSKNTYLYIANVYHACRAMRGAI